MKVIEWESYLSCVFPSLWFLALFPSLQSKFLVQALFLSLYKSFSNVLAEPLREAFKDGNLQPSDHVDEMAIDLEGSSAMELDKQNAKPKKRCFPVFLI